MACGGPRLPLDLNRGLTLLEGCCKEAGLPGDGAVPGLSSGAP